MEGARFHRSGGAALCPAIMASAAGCTGPVAAIRAGGQIVIFWKLSRSAVDQAADIAA
jgi:hypothetical protein